MKITVWYKQNSKTKEYEYNHFENGWKANQIPNAKPQPIKPEFKAQNDWKNYTWLPKFGHLVNNKIEREN